MVRVGNSGWSEKDLQPGNAKPVPGVYHCLVDECKELDDRIEIKLCVLAGEPGTEKGKVFTERFSLYGADDQKTLTCTRRLTRLALCLGLITREEINQDKEVDFGFAVGRPIVCKMVPHEYTNKEGKEVKSSQLDFFGFWSVGDDDVKNVPKDPNFLGGGSAATASKSTVAAAAGNGRKPVAAATTKADDFDDI
jgi:hypothetical protein